MKLKNIFSIVFLGALASGVASCDFLETTPKDFSDPETFYTTQDECEMALAGVYTTLARQAVYGCDYSVRLAGVDDLSFYSNTKKTEHPSLNVFTPSTIEVANAWDELYKGINNANVLLEHIDKGDFDPVAQRRIKGEAQFLRAYYHFLLVQGWYEVPIRKQSLQDKRYTELAPTSHLDALDWIIDEMRQSRELVDSTLYDQSPSHVKKTTVEGILARVFLWKAGYAEFTKDFPEEMEGVDVEELKHCYDSAAYYAGKVVASGKHKLIPTDENHQNIYMLWKNIANDDYDTEFNESMWEVEFKGNRQNGTYTAGTIGAFIGNYQYPPSMTHPLGYCVTYYNPTGLLWDLLTEEDDPDDEQAEPKDLRKDLSMAEYVWKMVPDTTYDAQGQPIVTEKLKKVYNIKHRTRRYCGKYRREWELTSKVKSKNYTAINFPVLRYSDVLLMLAEAEYAKANDDVMAGGAPSATVLEAINQVRERANVSAYTGEETPFFQKIMDERGRELCFESLRRFDLVRWGIYYDQIHTELLKHSSAWDKSNLPAAQQYVRNTEPKHAFFPIPTTELTVNTEMNQNIFWN